MSIWNPWHGCIKYSEGCRHCYVYRRDESIGKDASVITKTKSFDLPMKKHRDGSFLLEDEGEVFTCMTSDFFLPEADAFRQDAWDMIRARQDLHFSIITKRIVRFMDCIPPDWGNGYENVTILCTVESQKQCEIRLPVFKEIPAKHKRICCEPLLTEINLLPYLDDEIELVLAGGESGEDARVCDYNWVLGLREQCAQKGVSFYFKQTGAKFHKDGRIYSVPRYLQHAQAKKANINLP